MPMSGANGGLLGADNTPVAGSACATAVTSTGCFCASSTTATVVVVAGGGGGGGTGGGGGGGVVIVACHPLPGSTIPVTIGAGGAGTTTCQSGTNGADSVFGSTTPITAKGGGGGGGSNNSAHRGKCGGSGGAGGDDGSAEQGGAVATNHGCTRAGFAGGKGDHATGGGGGGAGDSGGKRGKGGMGACLLPLGVPKCMVDNGFAGGGGGGWDSTAGCNAQNAILLDDACNARARTANRNAPIGLNFAGFKGGMGGGGDAKLLSPNFNPATPDPHASATTAGSANTGGGGGGSGSAGGSGVVIVVQCGAATIKNGIYNVKEHYAAVRASRWV